MYRSDYSARLRDRITGRFISRVQYDFQQLPFFDEDVALDTEHHSSVSSSTLSSPRSQTYANASLGPVFSSTMAAVPQNISLTDVQFQALLDTLRPADSRGPKALAPEKFTGKETSKEAQTWLDSASRYVHSFGKDIDERDILKLLAYFTDEASAWAHRQTSEITRWQDQRNAHYIGHTEDSRPATPGAFPIAHPANAVLGTAYPDITVVADWNALLNWNVYDPLLTWNDFENAFLDTFVSTSRKENAQLDLSRLHRQGKLSRIADYNVAFENICWDTGFGRSYLVTRYKEELGYQILSSIYASPTQIPDEDDLSAWMDRALNIDKGLEIAKRYSNKDHTGSSSSNKPSTSQGRPQYKSQTKVTQVTSTASSSKRPRPSASSSNTSNRPPIKCFNCGKPGHKAIDCPDLHKIKQETRQVRSMSDDDLTQQIRELQQESAKRKKGKKLGKGKGRQ